MNESENYQPSALRTTELIPDFQSEPKQHTENSAILRTGYEPGSVYGNHKTNRTFPYPTLTD